MEIGNIAEQNKGFRYLLNCIDIYTVCKKKNGRIENQFQKRTDIIGLHPGSLYPGRGHLLDVSKEYTQMAFLKNISRNMRAYKNANFEKTGKHSN